MAFLQIIGGLLLLWIGIELLSEEEESEEDAQTHDNLMAAIRTILVADLVMSLDNVIGVAAAAKGNMVLLILGLAISIPLVIFGSKFMISLMTRFPIVVRLGAALIGWVAGETLVSDVTLHDLIGHLAWLHWAVPLGCAVLVLSWSRLLQRFRPPQQAPTA